MTALETVTQSSDHVSFSLGVPLMTQTHTCVNTKQDRCEVQRGPERALQTARTNPSQSTHKPDSSFNIFTFRYADKIMRKSQKPNIAVLEPTASQPKRDKTNLSYFQHGLLLFPKPGGRSWINNPWEDAEKAGQRFSSHICVFAQWSTDPPLCLCPCQCLLAVGKSLGSSSCAAAPVGFTFPLLRPPDAALRLVLAWAESCKTNSCGLPPFLSLPPCPGSSPLADLRLPWASA